MKMDQLYRRFRGLCGLPLRAVTRCGCPVCSPLTESRSTELRPLIWGLRRRSPPALPQSGKGARRTGTRIRLREKHGISFWLFQNRKRRGLFAGILAAVLVMAFLSRFLWVVRIDGTLEHYTEAQLREQLREYGLREGTLVSELDAASIEQSMMIANDDLAFIAVNLRGSTAEVIVRPALGSRRSRAPADSPPMWCRCMTGWCAASRYIPARPR